MVNLTLPTNSEVVPGKIHGTDGPGKIIFNIYRWNREDNQNPRLDKYFVDKKKLGPMTLDALMFIKSDIDPTLTFRRSCREGICGSCSWMLRTNTLACLKPIKDKEINIYTSSHEGAERPN